MKLTQTFALTAQLATIVVCESYPVNIENWSNNNQSDFDSSTAYLNGSKALSYPFEYDPSRRQMEGTGPISRYDENRTLISQMVDELRHTAPKPHLRATHL